ISHLIVILREHDKAVSGDIARRAAVPAPAKPRILAGIGESFAISLRQLSEIAVVSVIAFALVGEHRAQAMMKVVVPLGVKTVTAALTRSDETRIVIGAFGNEKNLPVEAHRLSMHGIV